MRTPWLALVLCAVAAAAAHADTAESLKQQGMAAAQQKDWELAREKFAASYALDPRPLTLFNLAAAQEKSDRLVAARDSYRGFLEKSAREPKTDPWRAIAKTRLASLDKEIPTLHVQISGFAAGITVELDGRALAAAELAAPIAVDPGAHAVIVLRDGAAVVKRTIEIARGDRAEVELAVPPPPPRDPAAPGPVAPPPPPRKREGGVLSSPWLWGVAGAVVLGAAAGGYYYRYGSPFERGPTRGTLGPGTLEIP